MLPDHALTPELSELLNHSNDDLWAVASVSPDSRRWRRHESLLHKNAETSLSAVERQELDQLRKEMDNLVYRRSFAMALLKWRGHDISTLTANPDHAPA